MPSTDPTMPQGDCQTGLVCVQWTGPMVTPVVATCVHSCTSDADCMTAPNMLCRPISGTGSACVSAEVADGAVCNRSMRNMQLMTGCAPTSSCIGGIIRTAMGAVIPDQGSCGQVCGGMLPACPANLPYCNPQLLTSTTAATGICSDRQRPAGSVCGQQDITRQCDTSTNMPMAGVASTCLGLPENRPGDGVCVILCNPQTMPDTCPATTSDPARPAHCTQIQRANPTVGVCNNGCSEFPNNCTGMGIGNGASCRGPYAFEAMPIEGISLCADVQSPVIAEWDFVTMPPPGACRAPGDDLHCTSGTFCVAVGMTDSACVRGCNTMAMPTGCAGTTMCDSTLIMGNPGDGVCH